jgi:hypothetical protein
MTRYFARILVLGALALSAGCASSGGITAGKPFDLEPGASARLPDDSQLRYVGIANDSRCPPKVTCIRAGDADVLLDHVTGAGTPTRVVLNTERATAADVARWRVELLALAPGERPRATLQLQER